jgi:hypothetical protein
MLSIDLLKTGAGWAVGNEYSDLQRAVLKRQLIFRTTDGGSTWTTQSVSVSLPKQLSRVSVVSTSVAYVAETSGGILKTTDGTTWARTTSALGSSVSVEGIDTYGASRVIVVGSAGWVAWSNNGGTSWTAKQLPGQERLRGVAAVTDTKWVAVGDNSVIYRTSDAGATWSKVAVSPSDSWKTTTLTSSSKSAVLPYGGTGTITGYLKANNVAAPGQTVVLQKSTNGTTFYDTSVKSQTSGSGYFSLSASPSSKAYYRAKFAGSVGFKPATPTARVTFTPKVYFSTKPWASKSTIYHGTKYSWYISIKPRHTSGSGAVKMKFERYSGGKYRPYKTVTAYAYDYKTYSRVKARYAIPYKGKWRVRAYHNDDPHAATYSGWLYETVK